MSSFQCPGEYDMKEEIQMSLIKVRGRLKWKVNIVKGNRVIGFIKPVEKV